MFSRFNAALCKFAFPTALIFLLAPAGIKLHAQQAEHGITKSGMSSLDEEKLRKALDAYDEGNSKLAEPLLFDLTKRYPGNYEANEALGSLYAESGDLGHALRLLQYAIVLDPRRTAAHTNLGAVYIKLGKNAEAVRELQLAAKLDPVNAGVQSNLGHALMVTKQPTRAAEAFAVASDLEPGNMDYAYNRALALFDSNAFGEAASFLSKIPPPNMTDQCRSLAGDVEERRGNYKQALLQYQAAAQLNPSAANLYSLTLELLRHWTWDEALQVANYGVTLYPSDTRFKVAAGIALFADNRFPQSAATFSALLAQDPNNEGYVDLLGRSCGAIGVGASQDCARLDEFAVKHPDNALASVYAAMNILHLPLAQQDTVKAEQLLKQAIAADPKLADAYYQLGVLAQQRSQWTESSVMLEKAVALRPEYPEAHYRLSRAYAHTGRHDEAQQQVSLHEQYSRQEKDQLNTRMQEVMKFLLTSN